MSSPREVIAESFRTYEPSLSYVQTVTSYEGVAKHIEKVLADAGYVIVPRPTEERVQAALEGFESGVDYSDGGRRALEHARDYWIRDAMTAALAAAEAADTRPRELHDALWERSRDLSKDYESNGYPWESDTYFAAAEMVAETFNLPEVNDE